MTWSHRDVTQDSLSACNWQRDVKRPLVIPGLIKDLFSESALAKLNNSVGITKLLDLQDERLKMVASHL